MKSIALKSLPHLVAVIIFCLTSIIYFYPQLEGKTLSMDDVVAGTQAAGEIMEYSEKTGKDYLWSNAQFGGMPRMMWVPMKHNKIDRLMSVFKLGFDAPIGMFLLIMIMVYILYIQLGANIYLAVSLAIATSLATPSLMLWQAGHYSKIATLATTPLLILGVYQVFEKNKYLLGGLIFAIGLTAALFNQHPQMTYYIFMMFMVYAVIKVVESVKTKQYAGLISGGGTILLASLLALGVNSTRMMSVYDFSKQTMRGSTILTQPADNSAHTNGLDFDYAMQWSSDWRDMVAAYLVPGFVGGGSGEKVSRNSESFKKYRIERAPLYWGQLPGTVGPMYVGVTLVFLFVLGLWIVKGWLKWWLGLGALFLSLCAMGSHFGFLSKILFDYFPMYNKFRAPQSILNALLFFIPILGVLALKKVEESREAKSKDQATVLADLTKKLLISAGIILVPTAIFGLLGGALFDFSSSSDQRYVAQGVDVTAFVADRKKLLSGDAWRSFFLVALCAGLLWLYIQGRLKRYIVFPILGLLVIFDLWTISTRYVSHSDFRPANRTTQESLTMRPVDQQLKSIEKDRARYRVQDFTINTNNSSQTSYFHNTIGGYDPAKLRRYQDVLTKYIAANNQSVYNMLNTKYFIVNSEEGVIAQSNPNALGNAWFVKSIALVNTPDDEFKVLARMDPSSSAAILEPEYGSMIANWQPQYDATGSIDLVSYEPDRLVYKSRANSEQLAIFSEIWYNGNRDWKSYINGQEAPHMRANYILRSMRIPSGENEIVFEFKPVVYAQGEQISMISWWLLVMITLGSLYYLLAPELKKIKEAK